LHIFVTYLKNFSKHYNNIFFGWCPFGHVAIDHQPLTALEQWKASRHRPLWLVSNRYVVNRNASIRNTSLYVYIARRFFAVRCCQVSKDKY